MNTKKHLCDSCKKVGTFPSCGKGIIFVSNTRDDNIIKCKNYKNRNSLIETIKKINKQIWNYFTDIRIEVNCNYFAEHYIELNKGARIKFSNKTAKILNCNQNYFYEVEKIYKDKVVLREVKK